MEEIRLSAELAARLRRATRAVALSGAGISRESGLGTFRGPGGLWEEGRKRAGATGAPGDEPDGGLGGRPEDLATPEAFYRTPGRVWRWYAARHATAAAAAPNPAHLALARWESLFPSFLLVTQNVDDLHQRAGSRRLVALHGTLAEAVCDTCGRRRPMAEAVAASPVEPPKCDPPAGAAGYRGRRGYQGRLGFRGSQGRQGCPGRFRPAVVWFGENLPAAALAQAARAAAACEVLLVAGTSAQVYPAAGLIETALRAGACVVEVNPEPTPFSRFVHLRLAAPAGEALPALTDALASCRSTAG